MSYGDLSADVGVHADQGAVRGDQGGFGFVDEGAVSGQIEEIYFYIGARTESAGPFGVG